MTADNQAVEQTLQLADSGAQLLFSGPPHNLTGAIPLVNKGSEKQKLRSVSLKSASLMGAARLPLNEMPFFAKLYPGEQSSIPGTLVLDSRTPPGKYDFELTVGDKTLPAVAFVEEVVDLRMQPSQITILAGSSTSCTRKFVAENAGNVDLPTGAQCDAPIFDSYDLPTALLVGLHEADKATVESMVKGVLLKWSEIAAGTLVTKREPIVIHPGQKISVDVTFELPADLKPLRHYSASLQLYNATLFVDIYTTAKYGIHSEEISDRPKRKPKESAK